MGRLHQSGRDFDPGIFLLLARAPTKIGFSLSVSGKRILFERQRSGLLFPPSLRGVRAEPALDLSPKVLTDDSRIPQSCFHLTNRCVLCRKHKKVLIIARVVYGPSVIFLG